MNPRIIVSRSELEQVQDSALREYLNQRFSYSVADLLDHEDSVQAAESWYSNDDVEIDPDPPLSAADAGVWVQAWVWVQTDDEETV